MVQPRLSFLKTNKIKNNNKFNNYFFKFKFKRMVTINKFEYPYNGEIFCTKSINFFKLRNSTIIQKNIKKSVVLFSNFNVNIYKF